MDERARWSLVLLVALASTSGCQGSILNASGGPGSPDPNGGGDPGPRAPVVDPDEACAGVELDPGPTLVRRLAPWEVANVLRTGLGVDVEDIVVAGWPPQARVDGLTTMAEAQAVTLTHVEAFADLAEGMAARVSDDRRLAACEDPTGDACPDAVASDLGARLFRRPLTPPEVARFARPMREALALDLGLSPGEAAGWTLQALLQAGPFLYRIETEPPSDANGFPAVAPEDLARRLAFLVWGDGPDPTLLAAAAGGDLETDEGIRAEIDRLLDDPRAEEQALDFVADWLGLANLGNSDIVDAYPGVDRALLEEMKTEARELARHVLFEREAPLTELLSSTESVMGGRLAAFYGLEPQGDGLAVYSLPEERGGLLTQGALLAQAAGSGESMIARGLFVLESVLCLELPRPPAALDISDDGRADANTEREASEVRLSRETCAQCHSVMEPMAHPFEPFDGAGRFRELNADGFALRSDGTATLPTGESLAWETPREFVDQLAATDAVGICFTRKPLSAALGRPVHDRGSDACAVAQIREAARAQGGTWRALLEAIATHPVFRTMRPATPAESE